MVSRFKYERLLISERLVQTWHLSCYQVGSALVSHLKLQRTMLPSRFQVSKLVDLYSSSKRDDSKKETLEYDFVSLVSCSWCTDCAQKLNMCVWPEALWARCAHILLELLSSGLDWWVLVWRVHWCLMSQQKPSTFALQTVGVACSVCINHHYPVFSFLHTYWALSGSRALV